jgi:hypothetical protein
MGMFLRAPMTTERALIQIKRHLKRLRLESCGGSSNANAQEEKWQFDETQSAYQEEVSKKDGGCRKCMLTLCIIWCGRALACSASVYEGVAKCEALF